MAAAPFLIPLRKRASGLSSCTLLVSHSRMNSDVVLPSSSNTWLLLQEMVTSDHTNDLLTDPTTSIIRHEPHPLFPTNHNPWRLRKFYAQRSVCFSTDLGAQHAEIFRGAHVASHRAGSGRAPRILGVVSAEDRRYCRRHRPSAPRQDGGRACAGPTEPDERDDYVDVGGGIAGELRSSVRTSSDPLRIARQAGTISG